MDFGLQLLMELGLRAKSAEHRCGQLEAQIAELKKNLDETQKKLDALTPRDKPAPPEPLKESPKKGS